MEICIMHNDTTRKVHVVVQLLCHGTVYASDRRKAADNTTGARRRTFRGLAERLIVALFYERVVMGSLWKPLEHIVGVVAVEKRAKVRFDRDDQVPRE